MAKIQFCKDDELAFQPTHNGAVRYCHPGGSDELQLFEVQMKPNYEIQMHAHRESEIIRVVQGQLSVGNRVLGPGDSVAIEGMTLYGFKTGPEGVTFLNFRSRRDQSFYTTEEFAAYRKLNSDEERRAFDERLLAEHKAMGSWKFDDD